MLLALLLAPAAHAGGFVVGGVLGPEFGVGGSPDATWFTASPMVGGTAALQFWGMEAWAGVQLNALQEATYDQGALGPHLANPIVLEAGFGFGARAFTAGLYGGVGFGGGERGFYARLNLPVDGRLRMGMELRFFQSGDGWNDTGGAALLYRMDVGGRRPRPEPPPPPPPPPDEPPPPVYSPDPYGT